MKERPIIFTGESPSLILAGHKTQTRRTTGLSGVNDTPETNPKLAGEVDSWMYGGPDVWEIDTVVRPWHVELRRKKAPRTFEPGVVMVARCPYGVPGDRLWMREKWNLVKQVGHEIITDLGPETLTELKTWDGPIPKEHPEGWLLVFGTEEGLEDWGPWRPSIHMPRWASRADLLIKDVQLQRLRDIGTGDSEAEGVKHLSLEERSEKFPRDGPCWLAGDVGYYTAGEAFLYGIWDPINAKRYPSKLNPYIWAIKFELVDKIS